MENKKILLVGGGGHCKSVMDSILSNNEYTRIGIVEKNSFSNYDSDVIVGTDDDLEELFYKGWHYAFVTVGSIGNTSLRRKLAHLLLDIGFEIPSIIDSTAIVSCSAIVGAGAYVGKRALLNAGCTIGEFSIINSGAIIEHDSVIGDFSHVSPGVTLCGNVIAGDDTHLGAGAVVRQGIRIGNRSLIGIGSVVVSNIPDNVIAYGNPCKVVRDK